MKGVGGGELNGPGWIAGVIVWLVTMTMVGGHGSNALLVGIIAIGMLAPAWMAATFVSIFFRKE